MAETHGIAETYGIAELAREFGVTARTIRHYEDEGQIAATGAAPQRARLDRPVSWSSYYARLFRSLFATISQAS